MELLHSEYFALFLIICLGFFIGNIKIKGLSLDISAIIFVALVFGHFGIQIPDILGTVGLILFIYTIGIQSGPGFFDAFKEQGRKLVYLSLIVVGSSTLLAYLAMIIFDIEKPIAIGIFTGALSSNPGLAAAIEATKSPLASIGFGITYPFGVIGVILFAKLYPKIAKVNVKKAENEYREKNRSGYEELMPYNFIVENENIIGKTIRDLRIRSLTGGVVTRVLHNNIAQAPTPDTVLNKGDYIRVVSSAEASCQVALLIGKKTNTEIPLDKDHEIQSVLVTNTEIVGKHLGEFNLRGNYNAIVTRIIRSGINLTPEPNFKFQFGDKIMVVCPKENKNQVMTLFGNNDKKLSDTNFFPVAVGIVLGVLLGKMSISFGSFTFNLGLTGGILVVTMLLSRIGKTGKILWTMSWPANQLVRQIGLMLFMASVGTKAGSTLVETYNVYGIQLFIIGGIITILPLFIAVVVGKTLFKINPLSMLGALTGSMTSTPGLAAVDSITDTDAPSIAYATVYPIAMVLLIICVQLLALL